MSPAAVQRRLERLRELWRPMGPDEATAMMEAPRTIAPLTAEVVQRRLDQLRALCDLTAYLGGSATRAERDGAG